MLQLDQNVDADRQRALHLGMSYADFIARRDLLRRQALELKERDERHDA